MEKQLQNSGPGNHSVGASLFYNSNGSSGIHTKGSLIMTHFTSFRNRWLPLIILTTLGLTLTACSTSESVSEDEPDLAATIAALNAELEALQPSTEVTKEPAPVQLPTKEVGYTPSDVINDTFDQDLGTFPIGEGMQVSDGAYLLGPFHECANDVGNFDNPVGCNAVCQTCGSDLTNFQLNLQFTFEDGLSERYFGVILRFVDENGDTMLDAEDYLLALGFDTFNNRFTVYIHVPNKIEPWSVVKAGQAGLLRPGRLNRLEITATNNGRTMDITLNEARIVILTADDPYPGETLVRDWADSGAVGFLILGRRVQARYDNFSLEPMP
jgi:hypothetical protein